MPYVGQTITEVFPTSVSLDTVTATTSLKTPLVEFTDGDNAFAISDGGNVAFSGTVSGAGAIGQGQTRSQPTRAFGTTYTNSTGRSIFVEVNVYHTSATQFEFKVNGSTAQISSNSAGHWCSISSIVPNGATYLVPSTTHTSKIWTELS